MVKEFEAAYQALNTEQKTAVDAIDGPVLVVAGPGTGKTQLLSVRVANILAKTDADPSNLLCLTFTNKAAGNMRNRLHQLIGQDSRKITVTTFHSFAAEVMNRYPDYFWSGARLSVAPDTVQLEIIESILARLPLDNPLASTFIGAFTALPDVQSGLKLAKEAGLTPTELRAAIRANISYLDLVEPQIAELLSDSLKYSKLQDLANDIADIPEQSLQDSGNLQRLDNIIKSSLLQAITQDENTKKTKNTGKWKQRWVQTVDGEKGMFRERQRNQWWLAIADVYEQYREILHQRGYYDYSDMLIEVIEQLGENPDMLADLQEQFQYMLIDEFQDTNAAQFRLAQLVADHPTSNGRPNIMAVGDDDQSIFAFNGAELSNMLDFRQHYPSTQVVVLSQNYRSTQPILDAASEIIAQAEDRLVKRDPALDKTLFSNLDESSIGQVQHHVFPTRQHQQTAVAERIKELWSQKENYDIAVLARNHESLRQLAKILHDEGLPISYEQQANILGNESIMLVCEMAHIVASIARGDKRSVDQSLAAVLKHPMWEIPPKTLWSLASTNFSQPDWLDSLLTHSDNKLQSIGNWFLWLARMSDSFDLALLVEHLLGLQPSEYMTSPIRDYFIEGQAVDSSSVETLSAINILRNLVNEFAGGNARLQDFDHFVQLNLTNKRVVADESWFMSGERSVHLLTIYRAKGLEFDTVFLIDAIEPTWKPRTARRGSPANLRLQSYGEAYDDYVRLLYVALSRAKTTFFVSSYTNDDLGREVFATPLLAPIPAQNIDVSGLDTKKMLEADSRWPRLESSKEKSILADRLDNLNLSASGLIDFLNIAEAGPDSFLERHLLHLPRARSSQGSYGTSVHAALETAQRLLNTSKLRIEPVLDRFESALSAEHLPPNEYELYRAKGIALLKNIIPHNSLQLKKDGLSEQRFKDIAVGKARVGGTIDRIDISGKELSITDYKTGRPLTSLATRDKTKAIKAWRHKTQLLFYMLLTSNSRVFRNHTTVSARMAYVESESVNKIFLSYQPAAEELKRTEKLINIVWSHVQKLDFPDVSNYTKDIDGISKFENDLLN